MEKLLDTAATKVRILEAIDLHRKKVGDTIGAMLDFELLECNSQTGEYTLRCKTERWMRNIMGSLHGGISAAVMDHAMGIVANSIREKEGVGPTVQLQTTYHRPVFVGENLIVTVQVLSVSATLTQMTAQCFAESDQTKICVSATGTYHFSARR